MCKVITHPKFGRITEFVMCKIPTLMEDKRAEANLREAREPLPKTMKNVMNILKCSPSRVSQPDCLPTPHASFTPAPFTPAQPWVEVPGQMLSVTAQAHIHYILKVDLRKNFFC